jgi:type IV pilus assembly protein PilE
MHSKPTRIARTAFGFTLIELLITMVIVGLLAFIAIPSFMNSIRKGRRAEAFVALGQIQQAQERYRANNATYASQLSDLPGHPAATTSNGYYSISLTNVTATTYIGNAQAVSGSTQSRDVNCVKLSVKMEQGSVTYISTNSANVADTNNLNRCWPL